MDEEELNNDLKRRITEVFDNYEDTTADEGWALLRQKYPPIQKDRGVAWPWYAAAAIVLMCLGLWFMNKPQPTDQLMVKQTKKQLIQPGTHTNLQPDVPAKQQPANIRIDTLNNHTFNSIAQAGISVAHHAAHGNKATVPPTISATNLQATNKLHKVPITNHPIKKDSVYNNAANTGLAKNNPTNTQPNKPNNTPNKPIDTGTVKTKEQFAGMQPSKAANEKAFNSLFASKDPDQKNLKKEADRKPNFSVYAATYFNYASGSDNQLNLGAGFTSDFRISNKLKLSTGVAIGQNSLSYNKAPVQSNNAFASSPVAAFTLKAVTSLSTPKPADVSKRYNASLVGLDIPINLKYQFNPQKSDTYISAGLSSGTFINETYQYVYANSQNAIESSTHNSFNSFDFAKTLNVSFGVGYPLGKSNRLIIEPFLKYPLEGLGAQQIRFGAGGLNLKLNFHTLKK